MYGIKQIAEDFYVRELIDLNLGKGDYSIFLLEKKNLNSLDAIKKIARKLNIDAKRIGYCGNKDKKAVTEQYISIYKIDKNKFEDLNDIKLKFLGYNKERLNLGDNKGNFFMVVVRNLDREYKAINKFKNYFDEQRFGIDKGNIEIGRSLVKKDFRRSCELLKLEVKNNDYVGALRKVDRRLLRFYVNAFQSYLFNEVLDKLKKDYKEIEIIGFLTKFKNRDVKKVYEKILEEENIKVSDFLIREMPELSSEGSYRKQFVNVKIKSSFSNDELNKGKYKQILEFELPKGCYATQVVKEMFK